ncbi:MAG: hypothetical protein ABEI76_01070 [Halobacteriales archaeon]
MGFRGDNRGVSAVVGFLLIFAILTVGYSFYQGQFIPEQNRQVEFRHSQQVQGQLANLRDAFLRTGVSGVSQSVTITVGAEYPRRSVGVNFAISGGRIQTESANQNGPSNVTFENITAVENEVDDYWDSADQRTSLSFPTKDIVYQPNYARYQNAPTTVYTNGVLFNQFDQANLSTTDQLLIQDNTITIIVIDGSLSESNSGQSATITVNTEALSVATNSISVENNATDRRINITVPTRVVDTSAWNNATLADQNTVHDVRTNGDFLTITLKRDQQYTLRMMKVGVGQGGTEPPAEYIVPVELPPRTVSVDTNHTAIVEVRDTFNNPENNVTVDVSATGGTFANPNQNVTVSDGRVRFEYQAPSTAGDYTLEFNISDSGSPDEKIVTREITVESSSGGGGDSMGPTVSNVEINRSGFSSGDDLQQGEVIQLNATVNDRGRGGTDIVAAEWWSNKTNPGGSAGNGFTFTPTDGEFNQPQEDVLDQGIDTSTWDLGLHELSLRGQDGNLNWGPETQFRINITGTGGAGGGGAASDNVQLVSATQDNTFNVTFTLENTGGSDVTIQNITVDSTDDNNADEVGNGSKSGTGAEIGPELQSNRSGSLLDTANPFSVTTTQVLDTASTISSGTKTEYKLGEFRQSSNNKERDPGNSVTITIGFSDGSEKTLTLNI